MSDEKRPSAYDVALSTLNDNIMRTPVDGYDEDDLARLKFVLEGIEGGKSRAEMVYEMLERTNNNTHIASSIDRLITQVTAVGLDEAKRTLANLYGKVAHHRESGLDAKMMTKVHAIHSDPKKAAASAQKMARHKQAETVARGMMKRLGEDAIISALHACLIEDNMTESEANELLEGIFDNDELTESAPMDNIEAHKLAIRLLKNEDRSFAHIAEETGLSLADILRHTENIDRIEGAIESMVSEGLFKSAFQKLSSVARAQGQRFSNIGKVGKPNQKSQFKSTVGSFKTMKSKFNVKSPFKPKLRLEDESYFELEKEFDSLVESGFTENETLMVLGETFDKNVINVFAVDLQELRKETDKVTSAFVQGKAAKGARSHTDGKNLYLHGNHIGKHGEDGSVHLTMAGWGTKTTRDRLNGVVQHLGGTGGFHQKGGVQHFNGKPVKTDEWVKVR